MGDHSEALQIDFDPRVLSYEALLALFWEAHSPRREAFSRQYMAAIFPDGEAQEQLARESLARLDEALGGGVKTQVLPLRSFFLAEHYHQKYILRRNAELMQEFARYDPRQFIDSTVAARLNGYLAGEGSPEQLASEVERFGLTVRGRSRLEARVRSVARDVR